MEFSKIRGSHFLYASGKFARKPLVLTELNNALRIFVTSLFSFTLVPISFPEACIPFGQHQGCKTSGIINVKMLANRNLIGYYFLPEVYEKEVSKQEIKVLRMLLLDVFDHVRDGQWERNLKMGDAN